MASTSTGPNAAPGADVDDGRTPSDLVGAVVSGVLWKAATRVVAEVIRVVVLVTLVRLLTPADYGVAGMALVVSSFAGIFIDPALGAALVQRPTIDERDRSTVFWIAAGIGATLTVLGVAASGLVADFFGEPEVQELFVVTSLCFSVIALSVAPRALLTRKLAYRRLEIREMASIATGGTIAIAVALAGFGAWAIVSNFAAYCVVSTLLAWLMLDWRPRAVFSLDSARNLGGFSVRVFSANVLAWGNQSVDKVLVGRFLGAPALGAYSVAYNAMQMPVLLVSGTVHSALTPAYSRIQDDRVRLERVWLRSKRLSVALVAPALAALAVVAPDAVDVFFGDRWDEAVVPLQLLCLGGLAASLGAMNWSLLQACGEAGRLLRLMLLSSAVVWCAFAAGLPWGIVGIAAFYAAARWLLVVPTTWWTTTSVGFDFRATLRAGLEMVLLAALAGAVAFGAREAFVTMGAPAGARLVLVAGLFAVVYGALVRLLVPDVVREVRQMLLRRSRSRAVLPGELDSTAGSESAR